MKAGQILDNPRQHTIEYDWGRQVVTFQSLVEDSTQVSLDDGFTYQELPDEIATYCPVCHNKATIYPLAVGVDSKRHLCCYCVDCDLLFRSKLTRTQTFYWGDLPDEV